MNLLEPPYLLLSQVPGQMKIIRTRKFCEIPERKDQLGKENTQKETNKYPCVETWGRVQIHLVRTVHVETNKTRICMNREILLATNKMVCLSVSANQRE